MATSRMFESYSADIDTLLREGMLRPALQLSLALPTICTALEDEQLMSSRQKYTEWCDAWLQKNKPANPRVPKGERLHRIFLRSLRLPQTSAAETQATAESLRTLRIRRRARAHRVLGRSPVW